MNSPRRSGDGSGTDDFVNASSDIGALFRVQRYASQSAGVGYADRPTTLQAPARDGNQGPAPFEPPTMAEWLAEAGRRLGSLQRPRRTDAQI